MARGGPGPHHAAMSDHETTQPPGGEGGRDQAPPPPPPPPGPSGPSAPPPPWPPSGAVRPLVRRDDDRRLAGVAGGLADYFGLQASAVRVTFFILALFGIGIPVYIVGVLAMPSPSRPQSYIERWFGRAPSPAVVLALLVGAIVLVTIGDGPHGNGDPDWGIGWGLALLFGGWLLFRADTRSQMSAPAPVGPPAPGAPAATWHGPGGSGGYEPPRPVAPAPPRPRSILGRLTAGIALASVGVAALLDQLGVAMEPAHYAALALTIVGLGLVVGAWAGRAYGLIAVGVVLLAVLFGLSLGPIPVRGGAGDIRYAPVTVETLRNSYTLGAGELELDLSELDLSGAEESVRVAVGAGQTTVIVPDEVTVAADVSIGVGDIEVFGRRFPGDPFSEPVTQTFEGSSAGGGRLELDIENGIGQIIIRRASQEF